LRIRLNIPGHCYSKKNSRNIFQTADGRMFPGKSKQLSGYEKRSAAALRAAWNRPPLAGDVYISLAYGYAGPRPDALGFAETVFDVIQAAGIVANDAQLVPAGLPEAISRRHVATGEQMVTVLLADRPELLGAEGGQ
jgi:hypothetical protein